MIRAVKTHRCILNKRLLRNFLVFQLLCAPRTISARALGDAVQESFQRISVFAVWMPIMATGEKLWIVESKVADELDLSMVRSTFADAHEKTPDGFDLVPELAAAIAGYSSQKTAREGAHLLIDVGASTLDMVSFLRVTSKKATGIESSVELLGAAALEVARRAGEPDLECELACRHQYRELIDASRKESRTRVEFKAGREVQVIATGGGCNTELHKRFIGSRATKELLGEVPIIFPSPPAAITDEECDTQRLLLAYGLTMDVFEKVELLPPSQTPNMPLQAKTEISAPGPEQC